MLVPKQQSFTTSPSPLEREIGDLMPLIPAMTQAPQPSWYAKFLSRKFLLALLCLAIAVLAVVGKAVPFGWPIVAFGLAPVLAWLGIEWRIDTARIHIPEVPGWADDVARFLLKIVENEGATPTDPEDLSGALKSGLPPLPPQG